MGCKFRRITGGEQGQQVRQIRNGDDWQAMLMGDLLNGGPICGLVGRAAALHSIQRNEHPGRRGP